MYTFFFNCLISIIIIQLLCDYIYDYCLKGEKHYEQDFCGES